MEKLAALALALGCTACSANATTLGLGQYGIVITALLVASLWLCERRRGAGSGLMLGLAMAKPIISRSILPANAIPARMESDRLGGYLSHIADGVIWAVDQDKSN